MNTLICNYCQTAFQRTPNVCYNNIHNFCSQKCNGLFHKKSVKVKCKQCEAHFTKGAADVARSPNHFCSKSCAAIYRNAHKKIGTRRSKLESFIEQNLIEHFPSLQINYNKTDAINSELDIYIPSLKLAFELNGLFHYEPIFGQEKLAKIQSNDNRKFQACLEKGIEFCIIDTSNLKYFKVANAQKYLDVICSIITSKL